MLCRFSRGVFVGLRQAFVAAGHEKKWAGANDLLSMCIVPHRIQRFGSAKSPCIMQRAQGAGAECRLRRHIERLREWPERIARERSHHRRTAAATKREEGGRLRKVSDVQDIETVAPHAVAGVILIDAVAGVVNREQVRASLVGHERSRRIVVGERRGVGLAQELPVGREKPQSRVDVGGRDPQTEQFQAHPLALGEGERIPIGFVPRQMAPQRGLERNGLWMAAVPRLLGLGLGEDR